VSSEQIRLQVPPKLFRVDSLCVSFVFYNSQLLFTLLSFHLIRAIKHSPTYLLSSSTRRRLVNNLLNLGNFSFMVQICERL